MASYYYSRGTGIAPPKRSFIEQMNNRRRKAGAHSPSLDAMSLAYKTLAPNEIKKYIPQTSYQRRLEYSHPNLTQLDDVKSDHKKIVRFHGAYKLMDIHAGVAIFTPLPNVHVVPVKEERQPKGSRLKRRPPGLNYWMSAHQSSLTR